MRCGSVPLPLVSAACRCLIKTCFPRVAIQWHSAPAKLPLKNSRLRLARRTRASRFAESLRHGICPATWRPVVHAPAVVVRGVDRSRTSVVLVAEPGEVATREQERYDGLLYVWQPRALVVGQIQPVVDQIVLDTAPRVYVEEPGHFPDPITAAPTNSTIATTELMKTAERLRSSHPARRWATTTQTSSWLRGGHRMELLPVQLNFSDLCMSERAAATVALARHSNLVLFAESI